MVSLLSIWKRGEQGYSSSGRIWRRFKGGHEACIEITVDPPWLPGLSFHEYIWPGSNFGCGVAFNECFGLHVPRGQLIKDIGLDAKVCFLTPVEDSIFVEYGLENVVLIEGTGTELAERRLGDVLASGSRVHKYQGRSIALQVDIAEEVLKQLA